MIQSFHRLRRHEEGQTLVLAALFGLILALCVLGTVNMGRAVYDKMAAQTACDNGAYSQAAIEARALNFTAYTNRAMVVHYASIMAASAYLTWLHFGYALVHYVNQYLKMIPYIGQVINVVDQVFKYMMMAFDILVALMTPLVAAANIVLYALQEGAWYWVYGTRLSKIPPEAHSGDSNQDPLTPLWPNLIPAANMAVFAQTRGSAAMPVNTLDSVKVLANGSSDAVQTARMHMIEIANSARSAWVAYGDRYSNPTFWPIARHWNMGFTFICTVGFGAVARTELGSYQPGGILTPGGGLRAGGHVFSGDVARFRLDCPIIGKNTVSVFGASSLDDAFAGITKQTLRYTGVGHVGGLFATLLAKLLKPLNGLANWANQNAKAVPDYRAFWISPYVYFVPRAAAQPGGGLKPLGNFAQPDVILGVAREGRDFTREPGAQRYFGGRHTVSMGAAGTGTVDFQYLNQDWPRIPGLPGVLQLRRGFNALCAAQVYYHRPGEWREMPNFFNPLWGARLMPVLESNAINAIPGSRAITTALRPFLLH